MKSFLQTEQNSLRAISNQTETVAPQSSNTRAASRSRNPSFSNNACAPPIRPASPPVTPVKTEPVERGIPRQMDTMELIMEQKDRQKRKERRESASRSKDTRRVELPEVESPSPPQTPVDTPHHYRYYSERVLDEASGSKTTPDPFILTNAYLETPTRKTPRARLPAFKAPQTPSRFPKTPSRPAHLYEPSSSRASTPMSSPARIVNLVSSPGPMRPVPQIEDSPEDLPYTVPPGPYPREKPDASYAAIIGQAIMASPDHRLALQDIYEWITTVYPYYQRGEQTWMNSVRHALSTMAVFRKVPRTRMEGKSLWAIFDQDVPCFADGGFRKSLCADMVKIKTESSKPGPKKRGTMEEAISRNAKRRKTSITGRDVYGNPVPPLMSGPVLQPFYSVLPGTHHQPYYGTYMPAQPLPAEVVFPPLPPSSNYSHLVAMKTASAVSSRSASVDASSVAPSSSYDSVPSSHEPSPAPSSSVTSSSVPELSPDDGASSSPPLPEVSNCDPQSANVFMDTQALEPEIADPDADFEKWLADPVEEAVAPHMTLLRGFSESKGSPEGLNASTARRRAGKVSNPVVQEKIAVLICCAADACATSTHIPDTRATCSSKAENLFHSSFAQSHISRLSTGLLVTRNAETQHTAAPPMHPSPEAQSILQPTTLSPTHARLSFSFPSQITLAATRAAHRVDAQPGTHAHALAQTRSFLFLRQCSPPWVRSRFRFSQ
ncbi:hypothetical protein EUX98_g1678 [Antrodiella citrinella]|uniref:Fork-head domain-containing protein n=1 Tax=Antrodiella citrinella TaxID=2447956 RepID=A0A4S4N3S2_9APHY|nr:hypothetical protein EUX98_g1678 [Antrodiella citrinella]